MATVIALQSFVGVLEQDKLGEPRVEQSVLGKSVFPESWDTDKILDAVADVATDPGNTWTWQKGAPGSLYTHAGDPSRVASSLAAARRAAASSWRPTAARCTARRSRVAASSVVAAAR